MAKFAFIPLALASTVFATTLNWSSLVESAKSDPRYTASSKRVEALSYGRNLKLWDKLELRYKMDGFSFAKHDFELRFVPQSFGERSSDKEHFEALKSYETARFAVERSVLLYDRYERGIRYVLRKKIQQLNKEMLQVNSDRIEVLHLKAGSATFNAEDLLTSLEKNASLKADLLSDSTSLHEAESKMRIWVPDFDEVDLDTSFLPTIEEIEQAVSKDLNADETFPLIAMAKGKHDEEIAKAKQDASKDRDYISHIGIGYSLEIESLMEKYKDLDLSDVKQGASYHDFENAYYAKYPDASEANGYRTIRELVPDVDDRATKDKFFVNLAFRLPFFDSNKDATLRQQVATLDAATEYLEDYRDISLKFAHEVEDILALIGQWKVLRDYSEQVNASGFMEQFAHKAGSDPLLLLRARESALDSKLKSAKLEYEIYALYLTLLEYAGGLAREDIANHLREGIK